MIESIGYYWRLLATGFCFLLFVPGAVVAFALLLPLRVLPISDETRHTTSRHLIRTLFRLYVATMVVTGPLRLTVLGESKLHQPGGKLIIANHPTLIDAVVLISLIPNVVCIAKSELTHNFFMRGLIESTGYITNSDPEKLLADCAQTLKSGQSLLLFPEGTRSVPGQPLKFLRGAAQIALRLNHDFTPVVITCDPPALLKGQRWYEVPKSGPVCMNFTVRDNISVAPYQHPNEGISLRSRKLTRHLLGYFQRQLRGD